MANYLVNRPFWSDLTKLSEVRKAGDRSKYIQKFSSFSPLFSDNPQNFYLNLSLICNVGHFCIIFRYVFRRKYTLIWPCLVVLFCYIFDKCSEYKILEPEIGLHRAFVKGSSPFHYNRPTSLPIIRIAAVTTNKIVVSSTCSEYYFWLHIPLTSYLINFESSMKYRILALWSFKANQS